MTTREPAHLSDAIRKIRRCVLPAFAFFLFSVAEWIITDRTSPGLLPSHNWGKLAGFVVLTLVAGTYFEMGYWSCFFTTKPKEFAGTFVRGANRWFIQGLIGSLIESIVMFPTVASLTGAAMGLRYLIREKIASPESSFALFFLGLGLTVVFLIGGIWLSIRICLWKPSMFSEEVDAVTAMKKSYKLTDGNLAKVLTWITLPGFILGIASRATFLPAIQVSSDLLESLVFPVYLPGISIALYRSIKRDS